MRLGIADHLGWAVAVAASADHQVVDRRRIDLIEPGMSAAPIHYESKRLDVGATVALVANVRASVVRAASAALDDIAAAVPRPIVSISLRTWPLDSPDDIAVQRRAPYEARADAIMYRQVLAVDEGPSDRARCDDRRRLNLLRWPMVSGVAPDAAGRRCRGRRQVA